MDVKLHYLKFFKSIFGRFYLVLSIVTLRLKWLKQLYYWPSFCFKRQDTVIGVRGNLPTALEVIEPEDATATIHPLPTGVGNAVVAALGQLIVTNVTMATGDANTVA